MKLIRELLSLSEGKERLVYTLELRDWGGGERFREATKSEQENYIWDNFVEKQEVVTIEDVEIDIKNGVIKVYPHADDGFSKAVERELQMDLNGAIDNYEPFISTMYNGDDPKLLAKMQRIGKKKVSEAEDDDEDRDNGEAEEISFQIHNSDFLGLSQKAQDKFLNRFMQNQDVFFDGWEIEKSSLVAWYSGKYSYRELTRVEDDLAPAIDKYIEDLNPLEKMYDGDDPELAAKLAKIRNKGKK